MTTDSNNLNELSMTINAKKVGEIVVDALQEILPHIKSSNLEEVMMAYAVMIKSTLIGMELSEIQKNQAKELLDQMWGQVLVDQMTPSTLSSSLIH